MNKQSHEEPGAIQALLAIATPGALAILAARISDEQIALLILQKINPHYQLTTTEKATLAGKSTRTIQRGKIAA